MASLDWFYEMDVAALAVRTAASCILTHLPRAGQARLKEDGSVVTPLDDMAEAEIRRVFKAATPVFAIRAEEGGGEIDPARPTWIIDPFDGTNNGNRGIPLFAVTVALFVEGQVELGVTHEFPSGHIYTAIRGKGFRVDGRPWVRPESEGEDVGFLFGCDWPREPSRRQRLSSLSFPYVHDPKCLEVRMMGCAAVSLALVATGALSCYLNLGLSDWDVASGSLFIEEAGGAVFGEDGERWKPAGGKYGIWAASSEFMSSRHPSPF